MAQRLLIVTTVSSTIKAFLLPYARHFRGLGWWVDAMANGVSNCTVCTESCDKVWEVDWSRNPFNLNNLVRKQRQICELLEREQYDLVHVHTPVAAFVTRFALRRLRGRARPKVIYTSHGFHFYPGGPLAGNAFFLALEKLAGRWTDYLVVINRDDEKAAAFYGIVPPGRICFMPGIGVDTEYYNPGKVSEAEIEHLRRELNLKTGQPLFVMVAEFNSNKRHRDALAALALLETTGAHLALAGVGPLLEQTRQLAVGLGISDRVHFLGHRDDIPVLIRAAASTLLPSGREGLPRSLLESLSLAVPGIGSDVRGIRDLLGQDTGILVKVRDVKGLARAMYHVVNHPAEARDMGKRGREQMVACYDLPRIIALHENLYRIALEDSHAFSVS